MSLHVTILSILGRRSTPAAFVRFTAWGDFRVGGSLGVSDKELASVASERGRAFSILDRRPTCRKMHRHSPSPSATSSLSVLSLDEAHGIAADLFMLLCGQDFALG